jgi:YVTN family beta-propeller protein
MVTRRTLFAVVVAVLILGGAAAAVYLLPLAGSTARSTSTQSTSALPSGQLALSRTIPLSATTGRIDHMSVDLTRGLLFVAAYGNNTVAVIDMKTGKAVGTLTGLSSPQGVAYVPDVDRLYVSNAGDGTVSVFDGKSLGLIGKISFSGDADNLRYDGSAKLLYVGLATEGSRRSTRLPTRSSKTYDFPLIRSRSSCSRTDIRYMPTSRPRD